MISNNKQYRGCTLAVIYVMLSPLVSNFFRCPPCKAIAPIYAEMAKKYPNVAFGKIDIDECQDAALDFEVNAVPTFVVFDGEIAKDRFSGADANKLETMVQSL